MLVAKRGQSTRDHNPRKLLRPGQTRQNRMSQQRPNVDQGKTGQTELAKPDTTQQESDKTEESKTGT